jgi:SAM domain (Sterile alpha motif)
MHDIRNWLESLGLTQYVDAFESSDVDLDVLPSLNEGDLEKLGVSLGHRKKMLVTPQSRRKHSVARTACRLFPRCWRRS